MAYEYKKLSEVDAINSADSSVNLIIEQNDEIKKLNIEDLPISGQVQADWNEEDATKASFIKNKPDLSQVGGSGGGKTTYLLTNGFSSLLDMVFEDGTPLTAENVFNALQSGTVIIKDVTPATLGVASETKYYPIISYSYIPEQDVTTDTGNVSHRNAVVGIAYYNINHSEILYTTLYD